MGLSKYKLGELIAQRREKYDGKETLQSWGVSRDGFIRPKQEDADTSIYNVFYRNDFVFNPARMELNSIALNTSFDKAICSSLYEVFYVTREDIILPEYLNMFIKRDEFARRCWYEAIGSARNYFRVGDLSQFDITLPSIGEQRKYVDVYLALQNNLTVYQSKVEELKLVCDGYIEDLKSKMPSKRIGDYIIESNVKNSDNKIKEVRSVSVTKEFKLTNAKVNKNELRNYLVVRPKEIAFVQTTGNEKVLAFAYNDQNYPVVVSSVDKVFKSKDENILDLQFLSLYLSRKEFDRYARFNSWGSAREVFTMDDMNNVVIPIPNISIQREIVNIHRCYIERQRIATQLKEQLNNLFPILIKGSLETNNYN